MSATDGSHRILEILWWSFVAGAILVVLVVAFVLVPLTGAAPPWADFLLAAGIAAFVSAVRTRRSPPVDGAAGRRALKLALEIGDLVRLRLERLFPHGAVSAA